MRKESHFIFLCVALLSSFLFTLSCKQEKTELDVLYDEVMEIHDDVMPKMSNIRKEIKKANKLIKDTPSMSSDDSLQLNQILSDLKKSEKAMWDWMHEFDKKKAKGENGKAYLLDEKISISNVRNLMLSSLEKSNSYHENKNDQ